MDPLPSGFLRLLQLSQYGANTLIITVGVLAGRLLSDSLVAFGFARIRFIPGSHLWPLHFNDLEKQIDEHVLGYPMQEFPGRYELHAGKGDVIAFQTRIWHSSWGGGANRRQMAWMMPTAPRMQWEIDSIANFNKWYSEKWSKKTGRRISDRLFETADPRRMKKIQLLKDLGA